MNTTSPAVRAGVGLTLLDDEYNYIIKTIRYQTAYAFGGDE